MREAAFFAALALALLASSARAEGPTADAKAARAHFLTGKKLIEQQKFADAIVEIDAAYDLDPQPEHLFNLGVAHQLAGEDDVAIQYYRLYLDDESTGRTAKRAVAYLTDLEAKAAAARDVGRKQDAEARAHRPAPAAAIDPKASLETAKQVDAAEQRVRELEAEIAALTKEEGELRAKIADDERQRTEALALAHKWERAAREAPSGDGGGRRASGVILMGVGAAALSYTALDYIYQDDRLSSHNYPLAVIPAGTVALLTGLGLYVSGEIAVHAGRSDSAFTHLEVTPTVGPSGGGLTLSMRF